MSTWPSTLPGFPLADSFREIAPETSIRTAMDQGPAKLRRRTTAAARDIYASYILSRAQVEHLEAFYVAELAGGSAAFTYTHPRTEAPVTCRFRKPPEYISLNGDYFRVTLEMEILP
jgi:hypothetical protein